MRMQALVIDDEPQIRALVSQILMDEGWEVTEADSAERAFELAQDQKWSIVFCDVILGGADGFSVLRRFKDESPQTKVVLMTGYGSASGALDATAFGAYDYLLKPFGIEEVRSISRAVGESLSRSPRLVGRNPARQRDVSRINLIGRSEAFIEVMKQVGRVAPTDLPVFLTGESGTGKGVVAAALHRRSERSEKSFVAVNCGAIPAELIESELFGHVKGAFTGADRERRGLWEEADKGTVFLDEITETTPAFQVKLLRALQEGEIRRVGSNEMLKVDVRVVAASNRDVEAEVSAGRFREDLFYRLNAVSIGLPPLRQRREDILPLAKSFAEQVYWFNPPVSFSAEALQLLESYPWPGNIRELENAVVRAAAMCDGTIQTQDLPQLIRKYQEEVGESSNLAPQTDPGATGELTTLASVERRHVVRVLLHTGGNKQAAARILDVDRKTLDRMIKRHRIQSARVVPIPSPRPE